METPRAWVLNLDAERELECGEGYVRGAHLSRLIQKFRGNAVMLVGAADRDITNGALSAGEQFVGAAWCPTPSALERIRESGARLPSAPSLEILQRVNHRRFCFELSERLGGQLQGAFFSDDPSEVVAALGRGPMLLKRAFSFAGRGRREIRGSPSKDDLAFIDRSMPHGLQVEPLVGIVAEFGAHGIVAEQGEGEHTFFPPTVQHVDSRGQWSMTQALGANAPIELRNALNQTALEVADALADAGYFGPFGVDAYLYRDGEQHRLCRRSEINARYSQGWPVAESAARGRRMLLF